MGTRTSDRTSNFRPTRQTVRHIFGHSSDRPLRSGPAGSIRTYDVRPPRPAPSLSLNVQKLRVILCRNFYAILKKVRDLRKHNRTIIKMVRSKRYPVGRRRARAAGTTPGSMTAPYGAIQNMALRGVIGRAIMRAGLNRIRRTAGDIRMARIVRRQALDQMFGGRHRDVTNIIESFIPSNQVTQRADATITGTPTVNAVPASLAAIVRTIL